MSAEQFLSELQNAIESESLYTNADGKPSRVHFDRHLYLPLIAEERELNDEDVEYSPPPLNQSERELVDNIKSYFESENGKRILSSWRIFLLRNRSRGRGVGLLSDDRRFFPDFIMWLQNDRRQHIAFIEPHGMTREGEPLDDHRVKFHDNVKEYERELLRESKRNAVSLHSYVVSSTDLNTLRDLSARASTREDFHEAGLFLPNEFELILNDVLSGEDRS